MVKQDNAVRFRALCKIFPDGIRDALLHLDDPIQDRAQEIRLRVGRPLQICSGADGLFVTARGKVSLEAGRDPLLVSPEDLREVFRAVCGYSVHSHQAEIAQGFVTFQGGHRVGLCGSAVLDGDGVVTGMRDVSSLNIRVARQVPGCADEVLRYTDFGCKGILLAGPPSSGKTTILRDLARQLASGDACRSRKVALVDERGELAAVWQGVPQNDVGATTDVLSGYPKREGILMAVRALSPELVICDEIGRPEDVDALKTGATCGVRLIASVHAATMREVLRKPFVRELAELGAFGTVVLLEGRERVGQVRQVLRMEEWKDENCGAAAGRDLLLADGDHPVGAPVPPGGGA